jgi:hypothetical protein
MARHLVLFFCDDVLTLQFYQQLSVNCTSKVKTTANKTYRFGYIFVFLQNVRIRCHIWLVSFDLSTFYVNVMNMSEILPSIS